MTNGKGGLWLDISRIGSVYLHERDDWKRTQFECRQTHGLILFYGGSLQYDFDGFSKKAEPGDVVLLPMGIRYSGAALTADRLRVIVVDFVTADDTDILHFPVDIVTHVSSFEHYRRAFEQMSDIWSTRLIDADLQIKSILYGVLADLLRENRTIETDRIKEILRYIDDNMHRNNLHLEEICERFYISESQLRRDIRKATGASPNEYIKNKRMALAQSLLMNAAVSVSEAARLCGFINQYYFSRCFHETFGISPTEFMSQ